MLIVPITECGEEPTTPTQATRCSRLAYCRERAANQANCVRKSDTIANSDEKKARSALLGSGISPTMLVSRRVMAAVNGRRRRYLRRDLFSLLTEHITLYLPHFPGVRHPAPVL